MKWGYVIGDIGSGTGISSEIFLKENYQVIGVEPNKEMREAAERLLAGYKDFISVDGTAEQTGLPDDSIDLIICAQAFHWFDAEKSREEFKRILKPGKYTSLIWNSRRFDTPFLKDYEELLQQFGTDYNEIKHNNITDDMIKNFFQNNEVKFAEFDYVQKFDFSGLKGRLLSSSYVPDEKDPRTISMLSDLQEVFNKHQVNDKINFAYKTKVYSSILI